MGAEIQATQNCLVWKAPISNPITRQSPIHSLPENLLLLGAPLLHCLTSVFLKLQSSFCCTKKDLGQGGLSNIEPEKSENWCFLGMETTETNVSLQGHLVQLPLRLPLEAELSGRVVHFHAGYVYGWTGAPTCMH